MLERLKIIGMGICVGVSGIMLAAAYIPSFYPEGYERCRRIGLIQVVLPTATLQIGAAVGWLYLKSKEKEDGNE